MSSIWKTLIIFGAVAVLVGGCAEVEPSGADDNDNEETSRDAGSDVEEETDTYDPCDECGSGEVCTDEDECVDGCAETSTECGLVDFMGEEIDCGGCDLGDCEGGVCPAVCEEFDVECGEVFFDGEVHECGECGADQRCTEANVCIADSDYVDIAAGRSHSCASRATGSVRCWGGNEEGQLGNGDAGNDSASPVTIPDLAGVDTVSSLNHHTCVPARVEEDEPRKFYCWGRNGSGKLGDGTTDFAETPVEVDNLEGPTVAAGGEHSCGVTAENQLYCWGANGYGRLGGGDENEREPGHKQQVFGRLSPEQPLEEVVDVAAGSAHSCALDRYNDVWCWGLNNHGQLGLGHTEDGTMFADETIDLNVVVTAIDAGFNHSCALDHQGRIWCWGHGDRGQLGQGEESTETSPVLVSIDEPMVDVSAGRFHTCGVAESGDVYCWGDNEEGQAGQSMTQSRVTEPQSVGGLSGVHRVDAGGGHSCGLTYQGEAYCWGANDEGQLGDGSNQGRDTPEEIDD